MVNKIIYPYGVGGQTASGIDIANDLETSSAVIALSARQGRVLKQAVDTVQSNVQNLHGALANMAFTELPKPTLTTIDWTGGTFYVTISKSLTGCTDGNNATQIAEGSSYTNTITLYANHSLQSISVLMSGIDITSTAYDSSTGIISIASVTGNIAITVVAVEVVTYKVNNHLLNMTSNNNAVMVEDGQSYTADITTDSGCTSNDDLRVVIDGEDVTSQCSITDISGGKRLVIPASLITADVNIDASASTGKVTVKATSAGNLTVNVADAYGNNTASHTVNAGESLEFTPEYTGRITFSPSANLEEVDFGGVLFSNSSYASVDRFTNVKRVSGMVRNDTNSNATIFTNCNNLEQVDVSHIHPGVKNFNSIGSNITNGYATIEGFESMDISGFANMSFNSANLESVTILNMASITSMGRMFSASKVRRVVLRKGGSLITSWSNAFSNCKNLEYVDISGIDITSTLANIDFAFNGAADGITLRIGNFDMSGVTTSSVNGMSRIRTLICTKDTPQNSALLTYMIGLTAIYVPDNAVDAYKNAWPAKANNIHPVSEYTE